MGIITFAPESLELFRKQQKRGFFFFISSSRLDLNRATGVKHSFPVQNFMLLTSYSCDNFCGSCCTVFDCTHQCCVTGTKPLCSCGVEKAEKLRDIFSLLLGDPSGDEKLCSKILFYYSQSKHIHEEIWSSSVWTINKLPSENSSRYLHFPDAAVTSKHSGSSRH